PQLWRTDGTPAGTFALTSFTDPSVARISWLTWNGSRLAFLVTVSGASQLWLTDGTVAGTARSEWAAAVVDDFTSPTRGPSPIRPIQAAPSGFHFVGFSLDPLVTLGVLAGDGSMTGTVKLTPDTTVPNVVFIGTATDGAHQQRSIFV